jgi:hypothetical protein
MKEIKQLMMVKLGDCVLRLDGYVGNQNFFMLFNCLLHPGDVGEIREGENINIIRDAVIFYKTNKHWNLSLVKQNCRVTVNSKLIRRITL